MNNEIKVLREFIEEFNPFYERLTENMNYNELIEVVKEIVDNM